MHAKAFEVGFSVIMGSTQADRRVAELVEIPVGGIAFPERISLPVREACVVIGGKIRSPRQASPAMRDEERSRRWVSACRQILIEESADGTREEHLTRAVVFAVNANGALGPGNVVDVDGQGFLAAQAAIIDEPEERPIARTLHRP